MVNGISRSDKETSRVLLGESIGWKSGCFTDTTEYHESSWRARENKHRYRDNDEGSFEEERVKVENSVLRDGRFGVTFQKSFARIKRSTTFSRSTEDL